MFGELLTDGRFPFFVCGPRNDKTTAMTDVGDLVLLEHIVNGFLAHIEPVRDPGYGDRRVLLGFAGHGGLRSILRGIGISSGWKFRAECAH